MQLVIAIDNLCRVITSLALFAVVVLFVPFGAKAQSLPVSRLSTLRSDWAVADFDGDMQPDLAIAEPTIGLPHLINLHLSTGSDAHFFVPFSGNLGLTLRALDIDGDHDLDLVITIGLLHKPVGIWINDGTGKFTEADWSLYSEQMWRGPPALWGYKAPTDSARALPQNPQSMQWTGMSMPASLLVASQVQLPLVSAPAMPQPAGQGWVRPPPAV